MFCTNCGSQVPDGQKFCTNCGAALQPADQTGNPSQTAAPSPNEKTPGATQIAAKPTQNAPAPQQSTPQRPASQAQNNPSLAMNPQTPPKRNKRKMIIVIVIIAVLALGGIGAATYFTHGFGLLDKQGKAEQTTDTTSGSSDSSASDTKKTKKDADEKPTVKVSDISFDTTQAVSNGEIRDVYSIKGTIENTTDNYVEASPSFIFKVRYKDKYGDEQSSEATLSSRIETPDGFENNTIFLAPHEKKEFIYYIDDTFVNPDDPSKTTPNAVFTIVTTKQSDSIPNGISFAKGDIAVDSVELKECPFQSFTDKKALAPDDLKVSLSCDLDKNRSITGTVTNTTQDKWSSAAVYYYIEMDGYYMFQTPRSGSVSFVKPDASADFGESTGFGSYPDGHTYEAKPIAVTYQVDKN